MMLHEEPNYQCGKPRHPIRESLRLLAGGKEPPPYVRGYTLGTLTDDQHRELTEWVLGDGAALWWSTGIGILEAAEKIVDEAVANGNIPAADSPYRHLGADGGFYPITEYDGEQPEPEPELPTETDTEIPTEPAPPPDPEDDDEWEVDNT